MLQPNSLRANLHFYLYKTLVSILLYYLGFYSKEVKLIRLSLLVRGYTLQLMLCGRHSTVTLIPILLTNVPPAQPNACDNDGNTALHHASAAGELIALRLLLQAGAAPFAQNAYAWTPLAYSSTAAAEFYFRNLIAEIEKRRLESLRDVNDMRNVREWQAKQQLQKPQIQPRTNSRDKISLSNYHSFGVNKQKSDKATNGHSSIRLVTECDAVAQQVTVEPPSGISPHGSQWSPVTERRRPTTPTSVLTSAWSPAKGMAARPRASTGD